MPVSSTNCCGPRNTVQIPKFGPVERGDPTTFSVPGRTDNLYGGKVVRGRFFEKVKFSTANPKFFDVLKEKGKDGVVRDEPLAKVEQQRRKPLLDAADNAIKALAHFKCQNIPNAAKDLQTVETLLNKSKDTSNPTRIADMFKLAQTLETMTGTYYKNNNSLGFLFGTPETK